MPSSQDQKHSSLSATFKVAATDNNSLKSSHRSVSTHSALFFQVSQTNTTTSLPQIPTPQASAHNQPSSRNMQSLRAWIVVQPPAHQHSDDSGSDIDGFSLINANPETSDTSYLDLDAVCNMATPLDNDDQPPSEGLHSLRPAVVDWVEEQSMHDQTSDGANELERARVENVTPLAGRQKQVHVRTSEYASCQEGHQQVKKVYDIPTLLKLRETQSAIPVMLRVRPEAIAGESIMMQLPKCCLAGLISSSREHLPVYGSCNVTSTISTLSRPFGYLQYLYWQR